jgi:hypothetical protein
MRCGSQGCDFSSDRVRLIAAGDNRRPQQDIDEQRPGAKHQQCGCKKMQAQKKAGTEPGF